MIQFFKNCNVILCKNSACGYQNVHVCTKKLYDSNYTISIQNPNPSYVHVQFQISPMKDTEVTLISMIEGNLKEYKLNAI